MREERLFNNNWEFIKLACGTELKDLKDVKDECWQKVTLPHDWLIYDTLNLYEDSTGWYRKFIGIEKEEGRRYLLNFGAVYMNSTVYINGVEAGTHHYGYSAFEYDITDLLMNGENEILVQVRYQSPNTRWYSGAGIIRDVTFKNVPDTHIASDGVYISPKKVNGRWVVIADVEIEGPEADEVSFGVDIKLCKSNPGCAGTISKPCGDAVGFVVDDASHGDNCAACGHPCASRGAVRVSEVSIENHCITFVIDNPFVWDIESPNLYELKIALLKGEEELDEVAVKFGLREIEFTADRGFFLNGRRVKLYGVCEHHDLGCLGAAFNKDAMRRKMLVLKDMGVNAIRTSHNMPARGLLELADEMGIMINSESFDMWRHPKTEYDYARFFEEDCEADIRSWVREDRNHPCVIMWSIGNEIYDCHADADAPELTGRLKKFVEESDYLHNAPVTHGSNYMAWEGAQNCSDVLKLAGYNYGEKLYDAHHEKHSDWMIYGSETSSTVQSRGIYHFPYDVSVMADDDEQCSVLGNCTTSWGAENVEYVIKADRDRDFSAGQFIWSGFDYIGEPTPYHTKNSYFGQIDTAGFAKDTYYIFKAEWTDAKKAPFVHVFPYWDFNEGQLIDVRAASNADAVELFVNGVSKGRKVIDHEHGQVLCPTWQVPYEKGFIEAVAYDCEGNEISRQRRNSFGDAEELKVKKFDFKGTDVNPELAEFLGEFGGYAGSSVDFYEIYAVDKDGNEVENADCRVNVEVKNGILLGLDNGDSTDFEQYKCSSRKLFGNRLLAVVGAEKGKSLKDAEICLSSPEIDGKKQQGININHYGIDTDCEIPIRKLEIVCPSDRKFTPGNAEMVVSAKIYPANATHDDICWVAVNDFAVKTNLADLESEGAMCRIKAKGDGKFRLRCMTKNGTDKFKCISTIEFEAEGLGTACFDPYDFIAGSSYTDSKGDIGNGNEKGVATSRDAESYVGYENIDFGEFGSDEITMPIFALDGNEYMVQIWEGRPGDGRSELLCDGKYCKPSIWNVYQPETYKLSRRVKGVTSIYFKADAKYHIKGFSFTKPDKAFTCIGAVENSRIYGDTFKVLKEEVTGIGNNVTLEFDNMDFGGRTARKLVICGSSPIEVNSIHIKATDVNTGETKTSLVEFTKTNGYEERTFDIEGITGDVKIGFVFLPGSNFDFKYFKFE